MTKGPAPTCFEFLHFRGIEDFPTCAAYPEGIHPDIYFGDVDHGRPLPGDGGLRWQPAPGVFGYAPLLHVVRDPDPR